MSIKKNRELMIEQIKQLRGELNESINESNTKIGEVGDVEVWKVGRNQIIIRDAEDDEEGYIKLTVNDIKKIAKMV